MIALIIKSSGNVVKIDSATITLDEVEYVINENIR